MSPRDSLGSQVVSQRLAGDIERYWADRGWIVSVRVEREAGDYVLRSNMIGGLPPDRKADWTGYESQQVATFQLPTATDGGS
jgi:hypothetical protein